MRSFDRDFGEIMSNLQLHVDLIKETAVVAGRIEDQQHHKGNEIDPVLVKDTNMLQMFLLG